MRYLLLVFSLLPLGLQAQTDSTTVAPADTLAVDSVQAARPVVAADSTMQAAVDSTLQAPPPKTRPAPSHLLQLHVSLDLLNAGLRALQQQIYVEGGTYFLVLDRYMLLAEGGYVDIGSSIAIRNGDYNVTGVFARGGVGYRMPVNPGNWLYFGLMGSFSAFDESFSYAVESPLWPTLRNEDNNRPQLNAFWGELVVGTETELQSWLNAGLRFKVRSFLMTDTLDPFPVYHVPGYGQVSRDPNVGLDVYVAITFPWN